jgi:hypothetical protein
VRLPGGGKADHVDFIVPELWLGSPWGEVGFHDAVCQDGRYGSVEMGCCWLAIALNSGCTFARGGSISNRASPYQQLCRDSPADPRGKLCTAPGVRVEHN